MSKLTDRLDKFCKVRRSMSAFHNDVLSLNLGTEQEAVLHHSDIEDASAYIKRLETMLDTAEKHTAELEARVYRKGVFKCHQCDFRLLSSTLSAQDGSMSPNVAPPACPNCDTKMARVLWEVEAREAEVALNVMFSETKEGPSKDQSIMKTTAPEEEA